MNFFRDESKTAIIKRLLILLIFILSVFAAINVIIETKGSDYFDNT